MKKGTLLKWSLLVALAAYCIVICAWARDEAYKRVCEGIDIEVKGNHVMDSVIVKGVGAELRQYPHKIVGAQVSRVDTRDIEKYLESLSNFESVNCMLSSGGRLLVTIEPLVPVMRVFYGDNSYYVNKDGKHIESKAEFFTHAPVVTGNFNSKFGPKDVLPLIRYIENDGLLKDLVSMIEAKDAHNLIIIPKMMGHVVNFGDTTRLEEKTKALTLFYRKVMPYKGWNEYDTVSVKFRGQVIATRRMKATPLPATETIEDIDPDEATLADHLSETN